MFRVEVNNGAYVLDYDEKEVKTIGEIVGQFQKDYGFRFAADPLIYDSSQGVSGNLRTNAGASNYATLTIEGRTYAMTCWIIQKVDEKGEPVKRVS